MNKLNPMQNPISWKAVNLRPGFWIERSWNIYNISQFNLESTNIGKRSLSPMQVEQIFKRGAIYSHTLVTKSKISDYQVRSWTVVPL
jgi:hypothetical protein